MRALRAGRGAPNVGAGAPSLLIGTATPRAGGGALLPLDAPAPGDEPDGGGWTGVLVALARADGAWSVSLTIEPAERGPR